MSGGVALFDFDNDGRLDIYLVNSPTVATAGDPRSARSELWRNRGDGTFVDVTDKAGVGYRAGAWGRRRRLRQRRLGRSLRHLLRPEPAVPQQRRRHVHRVTAKAGVGDPRWSTGAAFADYDSDGWLDLFVANYVKCGSTRCPSSARARPASFAASRCSAAREACPAPATRSIATTATARSPTSREGRRGRSRRTLRHGRRLERLRRRRRAGSLRRQRCRPELPVPEHRQRHVHDVSLQAGTALSEDGTEQGSMGVAVGDYDHRAAGASSSRTSPTSTTRSIATTRASSSPMPRSSRRPRKPASRSSAGARILRLRQRRLARPVRRQRPRLSAGRARRARRRVSRSASCCTATTATARSRRSRRRRRCHQRAAVSRGSQSAISTTTATSTSSSTISTARRRCCATTAAIAATSWSWISRAAAATAAPWAPS